MLLFTQQPVWEGEKGRIRNGSQRHMVGGQRRTTGKFRQGGKHHKGQRLRQSRLCQRDMGTMQRQLRMRIVLVPVLHVQVMLAQKRQKRQLRCFRQVFPIMLHQGRHAQHLRQHIVAGGKLQDQNPNQDALHVVKV